MPGTYKVDETTPPSTLFSKEKKYDGGMVSGLLRKKSDPSPEPFPTGTRITAPTSDETPDHKGTIEAIVCANDITSFIPSSASTLNVKDTYVLRLESGPAIEFNYAKLYNIFHPPDLQSFSISDVSTSAVPFWIVDGAEVTMDLNGEYQKEFISKPPNSTYQLSIRR